MRMPRQGRRRFLTAAAVVLAAPSCTREQTPPRLPRIGFLSPTVRGPRNEAFVQGLRNLGYVDGRTAIVEMRFADGHPERLAPHVDELIRAGVDVLVVGSTIGARAARQATTSLPIVFAGSSDPIAGGIVSNLARPGGNVTGVSLAYGDGVAGKWLELLKDAAPHVARCAALWSASNAAAEAFVRELETAARTMRVTLDAHHASRPAELDAAFAAIAASAAQALVVTPSPFAASAQDRLVRFAAERALPAMYFSEEFAEAGGLMSYGPSIADAYRHAASHVDRILKGARPGDLPVEQPTRFDLVVNARTAQRLGLALPQPILLRATRVIG
jgi:putative ABC transport system substrate-binding protein